MLPQLVGTVFVTLGSLFISAPVGIGCAVFLAELSQSWLADRMRPVIALLAAVPSVIYGFFGVTVVVLAASVASGLPLLIHLSYALLATLLICAIWVWSNAHWLEVARETRSYTTQVGKYAQERFTTRNRSILPKFWIEIRDRSSLPDHRASQVFELPPNGSRTWTVKTMCRRRGKFTLGPYSIVTGDPLGIFHRRRIVPDRRTIIVYPEVVELPRFELPAGDLPGGYALRQRANYVTPNASGIREYVPGDALSRIHWLSTARTGKLMTKEFELDPASDAGVAPRTPRVARRNSSAVQPALRSRRPG
jgi:uncharacterized protein (DUF58 family)